MEESIATSPKSEAPPGKSTRNFGRPFGPVIRVHAGDRITLDLSPEIQNILNQLLNQTDHDAEEIFLRSLILYKAAVDATEEGKKIAILTSEDEVDQDIINL